MRYEAIEKRRDDLGPARSTAEQLIYEAIETEIMDMVLAEAINHKEGIDRAEAAARAYLESITVYRSAHQGH